MDLISHVRGRLVDFYTHLKLEENLQKLYQQKGSIIEGYSEGNLLEMDDFDQQLMEDGE
jgi:hypothetical protein